MNSKKDFFPDEWNEEKVIDAIIEAKGNINNTTVYVTDTDGTKIYKSYISTGQTIIIAIKTNGVLKTAYPKL